MSSLNLIRPDLLTLHGYIPASEPLSCHLHSNELPFAPVSIHHVALNYYPDPKQQHALQARIADYCQVSSNQIALTRGSDDGIDLVMRLFLRPGIDSILQCPPTFSMYAFFARLQQASVLDCPLDKDASGFCLSTQKLLATWQPYCKLIILCSPNNPTGHLLTLTTIADLCAHFAHKAMIVVDEAYIDFARTPSAITLLSSFDNLLVLRTLSKAYGLAGLRLGFVAAAEPVINVLKNIIPPYHLSSAVMHLAQRALTDKAWFTTAIDHITNERTRLTAALQQSPWITVVYPSYGNFILVETPYADALVRWFAEHDIAVRYFTNAASLQNMLRITVGETAQNQRLLATLTAFSGG